MKIPTLFPTFLAITPTSILYFYFRLLYDYLENVISGFSNAEWIKDNHIHINQWDATMNNYK